MWVKRESPEERSMTFINHLKNSERAMVTCQDFYGKFGFDRDSAYLKSRTLLKQNRIGMYKIYDPKETRTRERLYLFDFSRAEEALKEANEMVENSGCKIVDSKLESAVEEIKTPGDFYNIFITKEEYETYHKLIKNYTRTEVSKLMGYRKIVLINGVLNAERGKFKEV